MVYNDASYRFLISLQEHLVEFSVVSGSGLSWDTILGMHKLKPWDVQYVVAQIFRSSYKNCRYILRFNVVENKYD